MEIKKQYCPYCGKAQMHWDKRRVIADDGTRSHVTFCRFCEMDLPVVETQSGWFEIDKSLVKEWYYKQQ